MQTTRPFGMRILGLAIVFGGLFALFVVGGLVMAAVTYIRTGELPNSRTLAEVVAEMQSEDRITRIRAIGRLKRLTPDREKREVAEALKTFIQNEKVTPGIRSDAIRLLGKWGQPEDAEVLSTLKESGHVWIERAVKAAEEELGGD